MKRTVHFGTVFVALVLVAVACAPQQAAAPGKVNGGEQPKVAGPKRITAAIRGDPRTMSDPINFASGGSSSAGVREIEGMLHAGLLLADLSGGMRPLLAEAAPTLENGLWKLMPDGRMETVWKLKPGLVWHDGAPLTAQDVVFASVIARDRSLTMSQDEGFLHVDTVEAPDELSVKVTWSRPFIEADLLFSQTRGNRNLPMPKHLLEQAYLEDKTAFTESPRFGQEYIGAGAYKLREWVFGSHLVLEANDRFVLGRPKIDLIEVKFILDTNTMVANLLAGALDLTLGRGLTPEQAILVREQWKEGRVEAGLENTTSLYPQFTDPDPAILLNVQFRRAVLHAIDRQEIVDTFLAGIVPVAHSVITPDEPEYKDIQNSVVRYDYDPRKSMELLDSLGLAKGPDGTYRDASGRQISIEIRSRTHALREKLQPVIADAWRRVGVIGEPFVIPEQRIRDRAFQATFPGFYFRFGGPRQPTEYRSDRVALPENNYVGRNPIRYRNPEYDTLIDRYLSAVPRPDRMQALGQLVHHMTDQLLLLNLFHEPEPVMVSNRLVNVGGRKGDAVQTWNAQEWDVKS